MDVKPIAAEKINRGDIISVDGKVSVVKDVSKQARFVGIRTGRTGGQFLAFNYGDEILTLPKS